MEVPLCRSHGILRSPAKEQIRGPDGSLAQYHSGTDHSRRRSGYTEAKRTRMNSVMVPASNRNLPYIIRINYVYKAYSLRNMYVKRLFSFRKFRLSEARFPVLPSIAPFRLSCLSKESWISASLKSWFLAVEQTRGISSSVYPVFCCFVFVAAPGGASPAGRNDSMPIPVMDSIHFAALR